MFPHLQALNLRQWIDGTEDWGRIRTIWEDSDFWAFVTRGPNPRAEFHINPGDEIFQQVDGELHLHYMQPNGHRALTVLHPGEFVLMPAGVPHSPRRPEGSLSLVIERKRRPHEIDRWVWYCDECDGQLYEVRRGAGDPHDMVTPSTAALRSDEKLRTCDRCGRVSVI